VREARPTSFGSFGLHRDNLNDLEPSQFSSAMMREPHVTDCQARKNTRSDHHDAVPGERLTDNGERVGDTLHETLDDAMYQAYSEYDALSDWRLCPDDADPLQYIRGQSRTDAPRPSQPGAVANLGDP